MLRDVTPCPASYFKNKMRFPWICTELSEDKRKAIVRIGDRGTGLGMAIAHQIIEEEHGGAFCHSQLNEDNL